MRNQFSLFAGLIFGAVSATAALPDTICIPFASRSATLSPEGAARLDSLFGKLYNIPQAYTISISGHTDITGTDEQNKRMGLKRAENTASWFRKNGFSPSAITVYSKSSSTPIASNETEEGRARNRRCEIVVALKPVNLQQVLGIKPASEKIKVDNTRGGTFTMASGTKINVPKDAFRGADGKPVRGDVEISYEEYRDPADFLLAGIPMSFVKDDEFLAFNSDGMFTIRAYAGGTEVKLAPDAALNVELKKVQGLPNAGIYRFDSIPQVWNESVVHGQNIWQINNGHGIRAFTNGKMNCTMDAEPGYVFSVRLGAVFIEKGINIDLKNPDIAFAKALPDEKPSTYIRLKKSVSKKKFTEFQLVEEGPGEPLIPFLRFVRFRNYNKNNSGLQLPAFNESWSDVQLRKVVGNTAMLTLISNSDTIDIPVSVYENKSTSRKKAVAITARINSDLEKKQLVEQQRLLAVAGEKNLNPDRCHDSLFCFYQLSKQWMNVGEDTLAFNAWIDYFNNHHEQLRERYVNRYRAPGNKLYLTYQDNIRRKQMAQVASTLGISGSAISDSAFSSVFRSVNVSTMGVWNCDQVERLADVAYVKASYVDDQNRKLNITTLWVVDSRLNGVLTYGGQGYKLTPYHFPYSTTSKNTLLAIDDRMNIYTCNASAFAVMSVKQPEKYTFVMMPAGKPRSKAEFSGLLTSR
jgi:hypothetical protein